MVGVRLRKDWGISVYKSETLRDHYSVKASTKEWKQIFWVELQNWLWGQSLKHDTSLACGGHTALGTTLVYERQGVLWDVIFFTLRSHYSFRLQAPASFCLNDRRPHSNRNKSFHLKVLSWTVLTRGSGQHEHCWWLSKADRCWRFSLQPCSQGLGAGWHYHQVSLCSGSLSSLFRVDTLMTWGGGGQWLVFPNASSLHAKPCADRKGKYRSGAAWFSTVFSPARWLWLGHQRLGRRGRAPLPQVSPQQPHSGADAGAGTLPPLAREALCGRADPWAVQDVHAVQGHERGVPRAAGDAGLQAWDRGSPSQTETEDKQQKNMNSQGQIWGDGLFSPFCDYWTSGCDKEKTSINGKKKNLTH